MIVKEFKADTEELPIVINFIEEELEKLEFDMKTIMQFNLVIEELFVNIAKYAYTQNENGKCKISIDYIDQKVTITVEDSGIKFNPLEQEDPDITLSAEERPVGGLGIFITKKTMDNVEYKYENGKNILILTKNV